MVWLGRADDQVKVRGFRVEPAEVELAIRALDQPGIEEAAVVARRRDSGDSSLAAFLVGTPGTVDLAEVRSRLRATLPDHMVPSHFAWLPALPLTPPAANATTPPCAAVLSRALPQPDAPRPGTPTSVPWRTSWANSSAYRLPASTTTSSNSAAPR
ncbi:hypothetical protein GCM10020295_15370 [Streptomyces cinereospinus]